MYNIETVINLFVHLSILSFFHSFIHSFFLYFFHDSLNPLASFPIPFASLCFFRQFPEGSFCQFPQEEPLICRSVYVRTLFLLIIPEFVILLPCFCRPSLYFCHV